MGGVRREAANRIRITAEDELKAGDDEFLVLQSSLDESWWKIWGGLDGYTGAIVDKALTRRQMTSPRGPRKSK